MILYQKTIPFLLLPLVENAVKHGIQQCLSGGILHFQIHPNQDYLWIRIRNPIEAEKQVDGMGMGLKTLKKRLAAEYGNQFRLKISHEDRMFIVDLKIPSKWQKK